MEVGTRERRSAGGDRRLLREPRRRPAARGGGRLQRRHYLRPAAGRRRRRRDGAALEEYFTARGHQPWRHRVVLCAAEGADCLLEGVTESLSGEVRSTYAGTFQL